MISDDLRVTSHNLELSQEKKTLWKKCNQSWVPMGNRVQLQVCIPYRLWFLEYKLTRAPRFSKFSLPEFFNSLICLYRIKKRNWFKSTCPGSSGSGKRWALLTRVNSFMTGAHGFSRSNNSTIYPWNLLLMGLNLCTISRANEMLSVESQPSGLDLCELKLHLFSRANAPRNISV